MATEHVRRIQELRRSNAAVPRPGRRKAGPAAEEWGDDVVSRHLAWQLAKPPWRCTECFLSDCTCLGCACDYCAQATSLPQLTDVLAEVIGRQEGRVMPPGKPVAERAPRPRRGV